MQELPQAFPRVQTRQHARGGSPLESPWRATGVGSGAAHARGVGPGRPLRGGAGGSGVGRGAGGGQGGAVGGAADRRGASPVARSRVGWAVANGDGNGGANEVELGVQSYNVRRIG